MSNRNGGRWGNQSTRSSAAGREAAKKHIREARELSETLGGTDQTVKKYLFGLTGAKLDSVLEQYGERYGELAAAYAEETMPRWKSGKVQMSGMVAERLYSFLPQGMPLKTKYDIAEELWRHVGPSSSKTLRFGPSATPQSIVSNAEEYISNVVVDYKIPSSLEHRFDWLTSNDVEVKQALLNHLRDLDKSLVVEAVRLQSGVMVDRLNQDSSGRIQHFSHTVSVGKHVLVIIADHETVGCVLEESRIAAQDMRRRPKGDFDLSWLGWLAAAGVVVGLIVLGNT